MMQKQKRFYKKDEMVWIIPLKTVGIFNSINKETLEVSVKAEVDGKEHVLKPWEIDKLKYSAKEKIEGVNNNLTKDNNNDNHLYFAKVKEQATIPTKRDEDAGYDIWACLEPEMVDGEEVYELYLPRWKPTLIPTGIATCTKEGYYVNFANERGSTGKLGMLVLSGIVDSGYRGEVFINVTPLYKNIIITSRVTEVEEYDEEILYPYEKAIAQAVDYKTSGLNAAEISYGELKSIPSERYLGALGSSGN